MGWRAGFDSPVGPDQILGAHTMFDDLSVEELRKLARAKKRLLEHDAAAGLTEVNTARVALAALWVIRGGLPEREEEQ